MISHALTIVQNEVQAHFLQQAYIPASGAKALELRNIAEGVGVANGMVSRDILAMTVVNLREERAMKNLPNATRNDVTMRVTYENQPYFVNLSILVAATHSEYTAGLLMLSRVLKFFQSTNVFTHNSVRPASIVDGAPNKQDDQLVEFKLIFDLCSPSMEEVNHMWGTLGGKQYPFALFNVRMVDLKFAAVRAEAGVITEIAHDFVHKNGGGM